MTVGVGGVTVQIEGRSIVVACGLSATGASSRIRGVIKLDDGRGVSSSFCS